MIDLERVLADIYVIRQISFVTDDVWKFNIQMLKYRFVTSPRRQLKQNKNVIFFKDQQTEPSLNEIIV